MRQKSIFILSAILLVAGTAFAQQKKAPVKPKPKPKTTTTKKPASAPVTEPVETACFPLALTKEGYKINIKEKNFKAEFEEIFELSPYDYSGYALKSIMEKTIRTQLGDAAANSLDMFAGANYVEIAFMKADYKKQIIARICELFADPDQFEKYINSLKKKK
jgi:hypothetical protein